MGTCFRKNEMIFDFLEMKRFIDKRGIKQKAISENTGIPEVSLSLILKGKRKCEAGEYVGICNFLGANPIMFMKPRMPK